MDESPAFIRPTSLILLQVLLATCFDDAQLEKLKGLEGQYVRLDRDPLGNVSATTMEVSEGMHSLHAHQCGTCFTQKVLAK